MLLDDPRRRRHSWWDGIRRVGRPGRVSADQPGHAGGRARHRIRGPGLRRATNYLSLPGRTAVSVIKRRADPTDLVLSTLKDQCRSPVRHNTFLRDVVVG